VSAFPLTQDERALLTKHRLAIFAGRIIHNAMPPITDEQLAAVQARSRGPLPDGLIALWRTAFGGNLDYDLTASFDGNVQSLSFTELFYPGSDHYHDLDGWIAHEQEGWKIAAEERGETFDGKLPYVPFGGFEYLERMYVCTKPDAPYGQVEVWSQGLPAAWHGRLNQDSMTVMGASVEDVFAKLHFANDPFTASEDDYCHGVELWEAIDPLEADGPAGKALAERLHTLMRGLILNWRAMLAAGTLAGDFAAELTAIEDVLQTDDLETLKALAAGGIDLGLRRRGGMNALDVASQKNASACMAWMLAEGVDPRESLVAGAGQLGLEETKTLLAALPTDTALPIAAVMRALADADLPVAQYLCAAFLDRHPEERKALTAALTKWVKSEREWASKMRSGKAGSYRKVEDIEQRADDVEAIILTLREQTGDKPGWLSKLLGK